MKFTNDVLLTPPSDNVYGSSHGYNVSQDVPALQVVMPGFPALVAPTCGLAGGLPCVMPLEGSAMSIKWHLRMHGHKHLQREVVQCPWVGCSDTLQWTNIPRHIKSIHLGVRFWCPNCNRAYTRRNGLVAHTASLNCQGLCLRLCCIDKNILSTDFRHYARWMVEDRMVEDRWEPTKAA